MSHDKWRYNERRAPPAICSNNWSDTAFWSSVGLTRPGILVYILSRRNSPWNFLENVLFRFLYKLTVDSFRPGQVFAEITWFWSKFGSKDPWLLFEGLKIDLEIVFDLFLYLVWLDAKFLCLLLFSTERLELCLHTLTAESVDTSPESLVEVIIKLEVSIIPVFDFLGQIGIDLKFSCYFSPWQFWLTSALESSVLILNLI